MGRDSLAWAAGFLDGEGCFYTHQINSSCEIQADQIDPRAIFRLWETFGGHVSYVVKEKYRDVFRWRITGPKAREVAARLLELEDEHGNPLLTTKLEAAVAVRDSIKYPKDSAMWKRIRQRVQDIKAQRYNADGTPRR